MNKGNGVDPSKEKETANSGYSPQWDVKSEENKISADHNAGYKNYLPYNDAEQTEIQSRQMGWLPGLLRANTAFLIILGLMLITSVPVGIYLIADGLNTNNMMLIIAIQTMVVGGAAVYTVIHKGRKNIVSILRFHKIKFWEIVLLPILTLCLYPLFSVVALIWVWLVSFIGTPFPQNIPAASNITELIFSIIAVCVMPALFEEFLFRGVILRGTERMGFLKMVLYTSLLFGILHMTVSAIFPIFVLSIFICYIVVRSNSIWAGVIVHFTFNLVGIVINYLNNVGGKFLPEDTSLYIDTPLLMQELIIMMPAVIVSVAAFSFFMFLYMRITKGRPQPDYAARAAVRINKGRAMIPVIIAIIVISLVICMELLMISGVLPFDYGLLG